MQKLIVPLTSTLMIFGLASEVSAVTITVTYTGTITQGYDASGVFGPPKSDLGGDAYKLVFTFDTTKGIYDTSDADGGSFFNLPSLGGARLTIGDITFFFTGNYKNIDTANGPSDPGQRQEASESNGNSVYSQFFGPHVPSAIAAPYNGTSPADGLQTGLFNIQIGGSAGGSLDGTFSVTTTPIPGVSPLAGAALGLIWLVSRRRK